MSRSDARLAVTLGEPAGIGPDLLVRLIQQEDAPAGMVLIGDREVLQSRAEQLSVVLPSIPDYLPENPGDGLQLLHIPAAAKCVPGQLDKRNSSYVLATIERAAAGCLCGEFDAMVTSPVHKGVINDAGIAFSGHTEFLAELANAPLPVMMLATPALRVALATTHLPLARVASTLNRDLLRQVLRILNEDLKKWFALPHPALYVTGLNPHAGEQGHLGTEELEIIGPVIEELRAEGLRLVGPLSADTAFLPDNLHQADAFLAMYHDQGLPVLKYAGFGQAVNITLGLPFIRTSVDHGTALERAGTGNVDIGSMRYALETALTMCRAVA